MKHLGWTDWLRFCIWLCMELNLKPQDTPSSFQSLVSPNSNFRCILWLSLFWISPRQVSLYSENSDLPTTTKFRGLLAGCNMLLVCRVIVNLEADMELVLMWSLTSVWQSVILMYCGQVAHNHEILYHICFWKGFLVDYCGYAAQLIYNGKTWGVLF